MEPEVAEGKYLYAIIECSEPREFRVRGIGERGDLVHTINHRRLAAVVSDSPVIEYDNSRRNLMAHMLVLDEVMEEFNLLPVRFGTISPNPEAIRTKLLAPRYDEFTQLLGGMEGRVELGLKAFWYEGVAVEEVVHENEAVRKMRDALEGRSLAETYYERIRLGEAVEKALSQKRVREEEAILSCIRPHVYKTRTNKITSDRMVLNAALLVDAAKEPDVDAAVQALDETFRDRLMFKYVGPVPPYNFINIVVDWNAEERV